MEIELLRKTNQGAFDMIVRRLYNGKGRAFANNKCLYRAPDGNKCAVGCLITDSTYNPSMESSSASYVLARFDYSGNVNSDMLDELQLLHDEKYWWDGNEFVGSDRLYELAKRYNLNTKTLDKFAKKS